MSKYAWTFWILPLVVWGLYSCWHFGYQSGYADGHETAWQMYQPVMAVYQVATTPSVEVSPDAEEAR